MQRTYLSVKDTQKLFECIEINFLSFLFNNQLVICLYFKPNFIPSFSFKASFHLLSGFSNTLYLEFSYSKETIRK